MDPAFFIFTLRTKARVLFTVAASSSFLLFTNKKNPFLSFLPPSWTNFRRRSDNNSLLRRRHRHALLMAVVIIRAAKLTSYYKALNTIDKKMCPPISLSLRFISPSSEKSLGRDMLHRFLGFSVWLKRLNCHSRDEGGRKEIPNCGELFTHAICCSRRRVKSLPPVHAYARFDPKSTAMFGESNPPSSSSRGGDRRISRPPAF